AVSSRGLTADLPKQFDPDPDQLFLLVQRQLEHEVLFPSGLALQKTVVVPINRMQVKLHVMFPTSNVGDDVLDLATAEDVGTEHLREKGPPKAVGLEYIHDQRNAVIFGIVLAEYRALQRQREIGRAS